jgi:hypothetical protein
MTEFYDDNDDEVAYIDDVDKETDPLDFLKTVMASGTVDVKDRMSAAKTLAEYKHRKKRPTDSIDRDDMPSITIVMPLPSGQRESKTICLTQT